MKVIGVLVILNSIILTAWWLHIGGPKSAAYILCCIAGLLGIGLIISDRISEVHLPGGASIKAATDQILTDAQTVSEIKKRVENQSATIDMIAKEASNAVSLSEEAATKNEQAEEKLVNLDDALSKANATLNQLNAISAFSMTVMSAQNGDRVAYNQLEKWADDSDYPFSAKAMQAYIKIQVEHSQPYFASGFKIPWNEGIDPSTIPFGGLKMVYYRVPFHQKPAIIEYIAKRVDISKKERLTFLIEIIQNDSNLSAVEYAGRYFIELSGLTGLGPMDINNLILWWDNHKDELEQ